MSSVSGLTSREGQGKIVDVPPELGSKVLMLLMSALKLSGNAKTWLTAIASGIVAVAIAFFIGLFFGRAQIAELQKQHGQIQSTLTATESRAARLEARRRLHLALMALEDRNFGIAQRELEEATKFLDQSRPEAGSELEKLKTQLATEKLVATEDLGGQRKRILSWATQLDKQL